MSDPRSRLGEARKQIRLAAEELEERAAVGDIDDVVADLEEAARLVEAIRDDLDEPGDDPGSDT